MAKLEVGFNVADGFYLTELEIAENTSIFIDTVKESIAKFILASCHVKETNLSSVFVSIAKKSLIKDIEIVKITIIH